MQTFTLDYFLLVLERNKKFMVPYQILAYLIGILALVLQLKRMILPKGYS